MMEAGAVLQVDDGDELGRAVTRLLADPEMRESIGRAGRAAFEREQGGVLRTLGIIERVLDGGRVSQDAADPAGRRER
jgi:3-deoxy-D-manno-octulosonic-acid transferase